LREAVSGTPGTLRILAIGTALVLIGFGVLGAIAANSRAAAIADARDETAQLVRLQTIRTNLVQADAFATNAFLVGGLEPADQRAAYESGIAAAGATLSETAAHSQGDDADALGNVTQALTQYTGLIEAARANNRQGFPVGVAYLKQASTLLRDNVLQTLSDLSDTTQRRVAQAHRDSDASVGWLWAGVLLAILALVIAQGYLTVRTRRFVSIPLAVALGIVVVPAGLALGVLTWSQVRADDVRHHSYRTTVALAQARIDAFDAKSAESLTLIARGSGATYEERFTELANSARSVLAVDVGVPANTQAFDRYLAVHRQIRELDDGANWDGAVALATSTTDDGSNAVFQRFDDLTQRDLAGRASSVSSDLSDARRPLPAVAVLLVLAGIAAAIAAWQGIAARLREYR
jgi:hypothetical protein